MHFKLSALKRCRFNSGEKDGSRPAPRGRALVPTESKPGPCVPAPLSAGRWRRLQPPARTLARTAARGSHPRSKVRGRTGGRPKIVKDPNSDPEDLHNSWVYFFGRAWGKSAQATEMSCVRPGNLRGRALGVWEPVPNKALCVVSNKRAKGGGRAFHSSGKKGSAIPVP